MQGYLEKQSSGVLFRKFQQRYFLLQRSLLVYYPRREDITDLSDPKHIDLSHCIAVGLTEGDNSAREFWIELPERTYWFRAPNTADRDFWVANLFAFNGASALDAFPISRHVYSALMDMMTKLTGEAGEVEGLFRVPGYKHIVDRTCNSIYQCRVTEALTANDVTVFELSSVLKKLLSELPESLLTQALITSFTSASATAASIRDLAEQLPMQNRDILMKLAVLIHRQIERAVLTKASTKSLSILLSPCLSTNSEAPFLDVNKLITIIAEQGSVVFGYSFSRAVAQQIDLSDSLTASAAKHDPWVNQALEKEVIVAITAEPHFTEIEPIDDMGIEAEHFVPDRPEQQDESIASNRSDVETPLVAPGKHILPPSEPIRNAATIQIPIQSQFQAHEFGFSSGSELTPRDNDLIDGDLPISNTDAIKPLHEGSQRSQRLSDRVPALSKGEHTEPAQRKNSLSIGNTNEAENTDSKLTNTAVRIRRLTIPQDRSQKTTSKNSGTPPVSVPPQASEPKKRPAPSINVHAAKPSDDVIEDRIPSYSNNEPNEEVFHPVEGSSAIVSVQRVSSKPITSFPILDTLDSTTKNIPDKSRSSARSVTRKGNATQLAKSEDIISQPDEELPVSLQFEDSVSLDIEAKFHQERHTAGQRSYGKVLDSANSVRSQSGNLLNDESLESGAPTPASERDFKSPFKRNLSFANLPSSGLLSASSTDHEKNGNEAFKVSRDQASVNKYETIPDMLDSKHNDKPSPGISSSDKKLDTLLKEGSGESSNSDMPPPQDRRRKITASTQTAQIAMEDSSTQTRKPKLDPDMKEMLETAQRQILDFKERVSHYQKKCKSLEQAIENETQASVLLQQHNISLQVKNRDLFKEQDSLNSDLEDALLQLEQAHQQIKMKTAINANLNAALSQQKLQHEAIVTSLENQNQAVFTQSTTPVVESQISTRITEASENSENVNIMLKKRLDMMRSRVQSRLHNSRENLASIESRAIMGLTESKQRIQRLQMELKGLQS